MAKSSTLRRVAVQPPLRDRARPATEPGRKFPLGATPEAGGVNFSLFAPDADRVDLLLFDAHDDAEPFATLVLDGAVNRTYQFWHVYVRDLGAGAHYAYRVHGQDDPSRGKRFNPNKLLIDPYSRGNTKTLWRRGDACGPDDNLKTSMRCCVIDAAGYDWQGDKPLKRPMQDSVIYEMHVGGFTRSPSSGVAHPGTFAGIVEKIPYLKALGVTAVELLPVFEFDDTEAREVDGRRLTNYWGYSTMAFFAPHPAYCVNPEAGAHVREFRDMVKALHAAGIEVILDVVFNHTDEGNDRGPTFAFKGLANDAYYYLSPGDRRYYYDYTGCGNTFNTNHPIAEKFIVDCLSYWVREMHVDGFRFDEASVLTRDEEGKPIDHPPVVWRIELDDELADAKVIAEAWDAAGAYQIGHFPGTRWAEWNGKFRDHVRRFVRSDDGEVDGRPLVAQVAARLCGSDDLYKWSGRLPGNSVNFVSCHDGFTLNDLVSYNQKHNEANGENNRDGNDDNMSWNCGAEGPAGPDVEALRSRQIKNFAAILLLSQGAPMIQMGDEVRRTQRGNNNAYCQDNETAWFDWRDVETHADVLRFWREMIALRQRFSSLRRSRFLEGAAGPLNQRGLPDVTWHGVRLGAPDWSEGSRVIAFTLAGRGPEPDLHVILNMYWEPLDFELPVLPGMAWRRAVDTSLLSPEDIASPGTEPVHPADVYRAAGRSIVVLLNTPI